MSTTNGGVPVRHFVDLLDADPEWVRALLPAAERLRTQQGTPDAPRPLAGRTAALVFHKPSLRTRVAFTISVRELGGDVVELGAAEIADPGRESLADVARSLSGMVDLVVVRTFSHALLQELARHARVPVVNALTDHSHPCQVLSDLYTLRRRGLDPDAMTVAWVGDGNNVLHAWLEAATVFGFSLRVAVPDGFEPDAGLFLEAERRSGGRVRRVRDPREAVRDADVVYTDTWTSMGHEAESALRRVVFAGFVVDESLMAHAKPDAVFMHCLPARRGEEVAAAVIDGPRSIVTEQAGNCLHLQKALMAALVGAGTPGRAIAHA